MAFYLGFDVAKLKLDTSFVDENGREQWHGQLPNDGLQLADYLLRVYGEHGDYVAVCESTSTYHYNLVDACAALNIICLVYNPILTRQMVKATIRGTKTDRTDALAIARVGVRGEARPHLPDPFPEVKHAGRSLEQMATYATSFRLHATHLRDILGEGLSDDTARLLEATYVDLRNLKRALARDMVAGTPPDLRERLQSIPGIGPAVACTLIGELGEVARFTSQRTLVAFAGLDPRIKQSGTALNHTGHLTKRGSPHLRRALFCAAFVARQHDPYFRALYERKRNEGRSYTEACCIVARKILLVARAVWISGQSYDAACAASWQKTIDRDM